MRTQNFCTVVICVFTFFVVVSTLQIKASRMIPSDISLDKVEMLSSNETGLDCSNCNVAGGKGAVSCSCTGGIIDPGFGGVGGGGASCEVTVSAGYYACCYKDTKGICRCPSCENKTLQ